MQDNVDGLWESFAEKYTKVLGPEVGPGNITHAMGLVRGGQGWGECVCGGGCCGGGGVCGGGGGGGAC